MKVWGWHQSLTHPGLQSKYFSPRPRFPYHSGYTSKSGCSFSISTPPTCCGSYVVSVAFCLCNGFPMSWWVKYLVSVMPAVCDHSYLLDKMMKQVESGKEISLLPAVSRMWWHILHSTLFPSLWSPKSPVNRQTTGSSCTAPSTKMTFAHEKYLFTVLVIMNSCCDEFCASEKEQNDTKCELGI